MGVRQTGFAFMAFTILTKIFGSRNDRLLKTYRKTIERITALETQYEGLNDDQLRAKTEEFKLRVAGGETLDAILPEAFAIITHKKASHQTVGGFFVKYQLGLVISVCCSSAFDYFSTASSWPTLMKAAMAVSRCARVWPALSCTRMRALPCGTTG